MAQQGRAPKIDVKNDHRLPLMFSAFMLSFAMREAFTALG